MHILNKILNSIEKKIIKNILNTKKNRKHQIYEVAQLILILNNSIRHILNPNNM